jgi:hypothetical protein
MMSVVLHTEGVMPSGFQAKVPGTHLDIVSYLC